MFKYTKVNNHEPWQNILPATEKENYISFHKNIYNKDINHAEKNMLEFPRWIEELMK